MTEDAEAVVRGLEIRLTELDHLIREEEQFIARLRLRKTDITLSLSAIRKGRP